MLQHAHDSIKRGFTAHDKSYACGGFNSRQNSSLQIVFWYTSHADTLMLV